MIRKILSKNFVIKYSLKTILRKRIINKMEKKSTEQLMEYDAKLFEKRHGKMLDWNNLQTYTEKMQWEKLFNHDPRKVICSDKYLVREWVKDKIGSDYLIPLIGSWKNVDDIDFDTLPNQFVLKTNCSSGDVIIVRDKSKLTAKDIKGYKAKLNYYLNMKFGFNTCELHYNQIKPMIIAESLIFSERIDLPDYKFLCFDGVPYFCWVDTDRYTGHKRNVYDINWNPQNWHQTNYAISKEPIPRPANYDTMIEVVKKLAKDFSHVRVDLYNNNGRIYFGELTFTNSSGFERIEPESADLMLGEMWKIETGLKQEIFI